MSIGISAKTRCNTSEFVDLLLSFEEMGRKSGMEVVSDMDNKTIDLRFTSNGLVEVRGHDTDSGVEVEFDCQTNILGPGFHKLVVDLLCDVAGQCGISFDVEDETDYYEHQDFSRMCREHFMPWLGRIVDLLEEKSGKDYGNMLVSYDMSWPVPENITGSYVTPFGRYRTARILGIKNSKGVGSLARLFFPCCDEKIDHARLIWHEAMHLLWCRCCFMPSSRNEEDAEVNGKIANLFEELILSGSALPIPKKEYVEICRLDGREPVDMSGVKDYEAEYAIGFRRGLVSYRIGNATFRLPGSFLQFEDDNTIGYWDGTDDGEVVRVTAYKTDGEAEFFCGENIVKVCEGEGNNGRYMIADVSGEDGAPVMQVQLVTEHQFTLFTLASADGKSVDEAVADAKAFAERFTASKEDILKVVERLARNDEHVRIIDMLLALPEEELTDELKGQLARAYNNNGEYEKALPLLEATEEYGRDNANWNFRMGYSYFFLDKYEESCKYFKRALEIEPDDEDAKWFVAQCGIYSPFSQRVRRFWDWFVEHRGEIEGLLKEPNANRGALGALMDSGIDILGDNVYYNIGGDFELTFAVESGTECHYLYPYLAGAMPEELRDKWKVFPCKQGCDSRAFTFGMYDKEIDISELLVREQYDEENESFSISYYHPALAELDEAKSVNAFYIILELTVGEGVTYNYIDSVEAVSDTASMYPICELSARIKETVEKHGGEYHSKPKLGYTAYECKPSDGEHALREDIICGVSRYMALCRDYMRSDSSIFCDLAARGADAIYLVITCPEGMDSREFLDLRYRVEDWCEEILSREETPGMVLGGAMGCDGQAYIDLIAYDGPAFRRMLMDDDVLDSMLCGEDGMVAEAYVYVQEFMRNAPTTTLRDI